MTASREGKVAFTYCCGKTFAKWYRGAAYRIKADGSQIIRADEFEIKVGWDRRPMRECIGGQSAKRGRRLNRRPCSYCGHDRDMFKMVITYEKRNEA